MLEGVGVFELSYPWLLLLLPLPWWLLQRQITNQALRFDALAQQARALSQQPVRTKRFRWQQMRWLLVWACFVFAGAGPKWLGEPIALPQQGRDLMLAVDLSGSMNLTDMQFKGQMYNRLDAVKAVVHDFIAKREGDRVGLVLFADAAYQQTPLTFDLTTVQTMMDEAVLGLVGQRTAIGEAIGLAVKRFNNYESSNKVLILLSDGANTVDTVQPDDALKLAKAAGVKIYTVGVGAEQLVQNTLLGPTVINPSTDLDEALLKRLASQTGGQYFRARDLAELNQIYDLLDKLEPIERSQLSVRPQQSLLPYPLVLGLLLWLTPYFIRVAQGGRHG